MDDTVGDEPLDAVFPYRTYLSVKRLLGLKEVEQKLAAVPNETLERVDDPRAVDENGVDENGVDD